MKLEHNDYKAIATIEIDNSEFCIRIYKNGMQVSHRFWQKTHMTQDEFKTIAQRLIRVHIYNNELINWAKS